MITNKKIEKLPNFLVDQIKAGEVVERPASPVKELLENAVDANARSITLHIKGAGLDLISIEDDGDGIEFQELPQAFERHYTSKIKNYEDLFELVSFGFRGEALASLASVARVYCQSVPKENLQGGGKLKIHGAKLIEHLPFQASKHGTLISVSDLFYNTPARLKFVKSQSYELKSIEKIVNAFILSHPEIEFRVHYDDKSPSVFLADSRKEYKSRFSILSQSKNILEFSANYDKIEVLGLADISSPKGKSRHQYLFVNNRLVEEKSLHFTIVRMLKDFWPDQSGNSYFIKIYLPAEDIDVNVHPNKTIIKFKEPTMPTAALSAALKSALTKLETKPNSSQPESAGFAMPKELSLVSENSKGISETVHNKHHHLNTNHNSTSLIEISNGFYIQKKEEKTFLVKPANLLADFFNHFFRKNEEFQTVPLLISEPIECFGGNQKLHDIDALNLIGFDIDFLPPNLLLLKGVPVSLRRLPHLQYIHFFLYLLSHSKNIKKSQTEQMVHFFSEHPTCFEWLNEIEPTSFNSSHRIELNEQMLADLLYES